MKATIQNTTGACERCKQVKPYVMGVAFQGDGTATFRHLCVGCERIERWQNQRRLFADLPKPKVVFIQPEEESEPEEDLLYTPQMSLFA